MECAKRIIYRYTVLTHRDANTAMGNSDQPMSAVPPMSRTLPGAPQRYGASDGTPNAPLQIGPYHIVELLGRGGMGEVYKAERRVLYAQTVAVKIIKPGFDSREVLARFNSERQALALMDHANIARVLDAGVCDAGRPYFVMEFVPGMPITRFADANKLTVAQRLALFQQVCSAVGHAHLKQIIHRDIKAGNVLAYLNEGVPTAKVIDFGIAKRSRLTRRRTFS